MPNVRVFEDLDSMLRSEHPDFVDIASPPAYHAATARSALEAGVHVLVEKPLCLNLEDFDQLTAQAKSKNRTLFCAHNWKHAPAYRRAGELVAEGRLGALRYVALTRLRTEQARGITDVSADARTDASRSKSQASSAGPWRLDAGSGGGILIDHGWHVFYLIHWLMGHRAPETVTARLGFLPNGTVDDVAEIGIDFGDGRFGHTHLSWRAPVRRTSAVLYGDDAMLEIEGDRVVLTPRSGKAEDLSVPDAPDDSYHSAWFGNLAREFEGAISSAGSRAAADNLAEARAALALTIGGRRSQISDGTSIRLSTLSAR